MSPGQREYRCRSASDECKPNPSTTANIWSKMWPECLIFQPHDGIGKGVDLIGKTMIVRVGVPSASSFYGCADGGVNIRSDRRENVPDISHSAVI
ncbi:hypothetical protein KCP77_19345 [Salmonella enterica subsp. enterica]|nr:hypothetical protein KCP77_19345 [Salmonella enterica subsp. enterica]